MAVTATRSDIQEFEFIDNMLQPERKATVIFRNNKFQECSYNIKGLYSYADWKFLYEVSKFIVEEGQKNGLK